MPAHRPHRFTGRPARVRHVRALLGLALVLSLALGGCGGTEQPGKTKQQASSSPTEPGATATTTSPPAPDPGYGVARVGQCFAMSAAQSYASVAGGRRVSCSKPHNTVVAFVGYRKSPVTPRTSVAKRRALGKRLCAPAYRRLAGGTLADRATSLLTWTLFTPGQAQLERGARWVRCDVLARSGNRLVPLPARKPLLGKGIPTQLRICQTSAGADVSCTQPHAFRVAAVYQAVGRAYPAPKTYTATARARCQELMDGDGGYWQPPSRAGWKAGDRFIRCLARDG